MWQVSQPLHLRHLAIIRDTALTNGIPHYVHYSFENFRTLVDEGQKSWDSVTTVTKDHKLFKDAATLDAQPSLDDNGFPKLPDDMFRGCHNDASLLECVKGADNQPLFLSACDPRAMKLDNGEWGMIRAR